MSKSSEVLDAESKAIRALVGKWSDEIDSCEQNADVVSVLTDIAREMVSLQKQVTLAKTWIARRWKSPEEMPPLETDVLAVLSDGSQSVIRRLSDWPLWYRHNRDDTVIAWQELPETPAQIAKRSEEWDALSRNIMNPRFKCTMCGARFSDDRAVLAVGGGHGGFTRCPETVNGERCAGKIVPV
jgi:hypothetical protein